MQSYQFSLFTFLCLQCFSDSVQVRCAVGKNISRRLLPAGRAIVALKRASLWSFFSWRRAHGFENYPTLNSGDLQQVVGTALLQSASPCDGGFAKCAGRVHTGYLLSG